ncbi:MAG TPA: EVE domain-containing protein [Thermoplasmata archaeon]|nr:EVE domain-containing protein [Thermoplasmata archaeon]
MAHWLIKEEPTHYSFADFERDRETVWNGIHNALALRNLRSMRPGDSGFYYHTGSEKAIVGVFDVAGTPEVDPDDSRGSWRVRVRSVRALVNAIPLARLRGDRRFAAFDLVRISRLSVVTVPDPLWEILMAMGEGEPRRSTGQSGSPRPRRKRSSARARRRGST